MTDPEKRLFKELIFLALRPHYSCDEDCWYSCPKSEDGCCDESQGSKCNCGADEHNQKVREIEKQIEKQYLVP
jgi:hypothetical protein